MSRMYIHSRKYHRRNRRLMTLATIAVLLSSASVGVKLFSQYQNLNQPAHASVINNTAMPKTGYINPYFMFKDNGKWVQDKSVSGPNAVVYYQYVNGTAMRQLAVYFNKVPTATQLASTRVLPVKILNGDGLAAGSLSPVCSGAKPNSQPSVKEINFQGVTMVCDPSASAYSVVLAEVGGSYELRMSRSKIPQTVIILYKDFTGQPDAQNVINIANSFKII